MKGLPPVPAEVWHLEQDIRVNTSTVSVGFWIFNSGSAAPLPGDLEAFSSDWILLCGAPLLSCLAHDSSLGAFRLTTAGAAPSQWEQSFPPNFGAVDSFTLPLNVAGCISWTNNDQRGSHSRTLMPLPASYVEGNSRRLTDAGIASLRVSALNLISAVHSIPSIDMSPCTLGTLHRQIHGAPAPSSTFSLFLGANPDELVATCRRRVRSTR